MSWFAAFVVKAVATDYESILCIDVEISALVIGVCSYSLEDVEIPLNIKDQLVFTDDETDEDNYYAKDNIIDLDEYILGILLANVPVRIVKKGAKLPGDGNNYRVISEDHVEVFPLFERCGGRTGEDFAVNAVCAFQGAVKLLAHRNARKVGKPLRIGPFRHH